MFTVYVLKSLSSGHLYTGQTSDIETRFATHQDQDGEARYTKGRGPWELVYTQTCETRSEAMRQERFLKSGQGREWLKKYLSGRAGPPEAD